MTRLLSGSSKQVSSYTIKACVGQKEIKLHEIAQIWKQAAWQTHSVITTGTIVQPYLLGGGDVHAYLGPTHHPKRQFNHFSHFLRCFHSSVLALHCATLYFPLLVVTAGPPPNTRFLVPSQPVTPNGIVIESAVFPEFTVVTDRQTDRQTEQAQNLTGKHRCLRYRATRPNNKK